MVLPPDLAAEHEEEEEKKPTSVWNFLIPMVCLIAVTLIT